MKALITLFVVVIPAVAFVHHLVMRAVEGYDGYGDVSHQTRRLDQITFESYVRDQAQRVS
jgi:hypothetical protein